MEFLFAFILTISISISASSAVPENSLKRQRWVLNYLFNIAFEGKNNIENPPLPETFPVDKPEDFSYPGVLQNFLDALDRGLLRKDGILTFYNEKDKGDTIMLFDLLYFAKDWDTFVKICEWGKLELHPLQMSYAFYLAVYHRKDCQGFKVPPLYEVFPNFFVPSQVIKQLSNTYIQGITDRRFQVNNTGLEWGWHQDISSGPSKQNDRWNLGNAARKLSYFRENVDFANRYNSWLFMFPSFMSEGKYPDIKFSRLGEVLQSGFSEILTRYNMERYANTLPPESPIEFDKPLIGYNSHLSDVFGRGMAERLDGLIPLERNYQGVRDIEDNLKRLKETVDLQILYEMGTDHFVKLNGTEGMDALGKALYGSADAISPNYYRHLLLQLPKMVDGMTKKANDPEYTSTAIGKGLTATRDPAFYKILTNIRNVENRFLNQLTPYTKQEIEMAGVEIEEVTFSRLETRFERYEFDLINALPVKLDDLSKTPDYKAATVRVQHNPFTYQIKVQSDREVDVSVRIFLGPSKGGPLTLRESHYMFDTFQTKLIAGENMISKNSSENSLFHDQDHWMDMMRQLNVAQDSAAPLQPLTDQCTFPGNLMLPKGRGVGAKYSVIVFISEFNYTYDHDKEHYYPCDHQRWFDQHSFRFPMDRTIKDSRNFDVKNMKFIYVNVFHKTDQHDLS